MAKSSQHDQELSPGIDRESLDRRRLPFLVATLAGALGSLMGATPVRGDLIASLAMLVVTGALVFWPVAAKRSTMLVLAAVSYLAFVELLVEAEGGVIKSGSFLLALLPVLWVALYCPPRFTAAIVIVSTTLSIWLSAEASLGTAVIVRKAGIWLFISGAMTLAVYQLRGQFDEAIRQRDTSLADTEALAAALRQLTALRDPEAVLSTATQVTAELISTSEPGRRRAAYFAIEGQNAIVLSEYDESGFSLPHSWPLASNPFLARASATLQPFSMALEQIEGADSSSLFGELQHSGITHGAWVPVLRAGQLHGILAVAGRGLPIDEHLLGLLVSLARVVELALDNALVQSEMANRATLDPLTGCTNRWGLLGSAPSRSDCYLVLAADLDGLKKINDRHGHEAGDDAIRVFGGLLCSVVRGVDTVARVGGDEFVVVLRGCGSQMGWNVAARLSIATGPVAASIGIAESDADSSFGTVMARADAAMYQAKRNGGRRVVQWSPSMNLDGEDAALQPMSIPG